LGARIIESIYHDQIKFPIIKINDYNLPYYTDIHSLVICSSYSGETEETIQNAKEAIEKMAKWMAIGTGGSLIDMAKENNVPYYKIDPKYNLSKQPRMAIGYSLIGQLVLASKAGLFSIQKTDIDEIISGMKNVLNQNKVEIIYDDNNAKQLAVKIFNKCIFFISSGHMVGSAHTINNQLNENSKVFSSDFIIPEINHHLMEGLKYPEENKNNLFFIFVNSNLYSERIQRRFEITKEIIKENKIDYYEFNLESKNKLIQAFEFIQIGTYLDYYLAILNKQDPTPIPWVDYFKVSLDQKLGK
jgi:glucose/mannose-6-phosphate isomerase